MRKHLLIIAVILLLAVPSLSAEPWEVHSDLMVNLTQSAYSDNWSGTELSNITWVATSNSLAQKQLAKWLRNKTTLKLAFGQTHLQKEDMTGATYWEAPLKSTDKIDLETILQFTLQSFVDPFVSGRLESQFIDKKQGEETLLVNPMLFTESAGVMRSIIESEKLKLSVRAGASVRELLDRRTNDPTVDGGLEGIADLKLVIPALNANLTSKLTAYQALFNSKDNDTDLDKWKALDYKLENTLSFKLWKLLSLNLTLDLIYDKEKAEDLQWRQILGLGFSYSLI